MIDDHILHEVLLERPASEGDQIKAAIRDLFVEARNGFFFTEENPHRRPIHGVNGRAEKILCICKHETRPGAVVMWYEDPA